MTPSQAINLDVRQAVDRLAQIRAWLDRPRTALAPCQRALRDALDDIGTGYQSLDQVIDAQPVIAVLCDHRELATRVVSALTRAEPADSGGCGGEERRAGAPGGACDPGEQEAEILRRLLLGAIGSEPILAAVRCISSELQVAPRAYPFALGLIGLADMAAILVRMHQGMHDHAWQAGGAGGALARLQQVREDVGRRVQPASYPGFTEAQVSELRSMIEAVAGHAPRLRMLAAAGYWRDLMEVAAHVNDADRVRVLSLLWGEEAQLTLLLRSLLEASAAFGHASHVHVAREALIERDAATGWFVLHPDAILRPATLFRLGDGRDSAVRVVGRYGHPVDVARAVLAARVATVELPLASSTGAVVTPADILALPALPAAIDPRNSAVWRAGTAPRSAFASGFIARFAEAKVRHLRACACRRREVTTLVACVDSDAPSLDPGIMSDEALPDLVSSFIESAQGSEPGVREGGRTRLFVLTTDGGAAPRHARPEATPAAASGEGNADAQEVAARRRCERLLEAVAGDFSWPREWTPGQPFMRAYALGEDRAGEAGLYAGGVPSWSKIDADLMPRGIGSGSDRQAMSAVRIQTRAEADGLIAAIVAVSDSRAKEQRLRRDIAALDRQVRARLMRLEGEGMALWTEDWRRRVAAVLEYRLARIASERRLGLLLASLSIKECELVAVFRTSEYAALDGRMAAPALPYGIAEGVAEDEDLVGGRESAVPRALSVALADQAVNTWLASMRGRAADDSLTRRIGIARGLMDHLIDEIGVGAMRLGLHRRLAQIIEALVVRRHGGEAAFAGIIAAVINGFVESLALAPHNGASGSDTMGPAAASERHARTRVTGLLAQPVASRCGNPRADHWRFLFARMVADNIAAQRQWPIGAGRPDLARIMAEFSPIPFEVEL